MAPVISVSNVQKITTFMKYIAFTAIGTTTEDGDTTVDKASSVINVFGLAVMSTILGDI